MVFSSRREFFFLVLSLNVSMSVNESRTFPGAILTKLNSRLRGFTFKSWVTSSQISCSQACLSNSRCHSTNFKEISHQREGLCELNDEQSLDSTSLAKNLQQDEGFVFSRFSKEDEVSQLVLIKIISAYFSVLFCKWRE